MKDCNFMIIDKIRAKLSEKGFHGIEVNVKGIYLFYHAANEEIDIIALFDCPAGEEFTSAQFKNIRNQLYKKYSEQGFSSIRIQTVICTNHVDIVRKLEMDDRNQWIIDMVNGQLIIYENQNSDFLGIRGDLEEILLSMQVSSPQFASYGYRPDEGPVRSANQSIWTKYFAKCNTLIVLINVLVFLILERNNTSILTNRVLDEGALYWPAIRYGNEYYRLFTYMFLHGGMEHLGNNMIVLLIIGDNVERAAGKWKYMGIYFGSGVIAGIASMSYNMINNTNTISIGASGAIFGVVGAMAYIVAVNKGRLEDISTRQIILFVIFSLYGGLTSQGVDNAAHIGGLIAGIILAAILYRKRKRSEPERG